MLHLSKPLAPVQAPSRFPVQRACAADDENQSYGSDEGAEPDPRRFELRGAAGVLLVWYGGGRGSCFHAGHAAFLWPGWCRRNGVGEVFMNPRLHVRGVKESGLPLGVMHQRIRNNFEIVIAAETFELFIATEPISGIKMMFHQLCRSICGTHHKQILSPGSGL